MSRGSSRRRRSTLGQAGASSLEFALVATPLFLMFVAGTDLGRYFITRHSLHTLVSEAARSAIVNCFNTSSCAYQTAVPSPSTLWAKVPFLNSATAGASLTVSASRSTTTGVTTVTATANYPFSFILPAWTGLFKNGITETTILKY